MSKEIRIQMKTEVEGDAEMKREFQPPINCSEGEWKMCLNDITYTGFLQSILLVGMSDAEKKYMIQTYSTLTEKTHQYTFQIPADWLLQTPDDLSLVLNTQLEDVDLQRVISNRMKPRLDHLGELYRDGTTVKLRRKEGIWLKLIPQIELSYWVIKGERRTFFTLYHHNLMLSFKIPPIPGTWQRNWQTEGTAHAVVQQEVSNNIIDEGEYDAEVYADQVVLDSPEYNTKFGDITIPQVYFHEAMEQLSPGANLDDLGTLYYDHGDHLLKIRRHPNEWEDLISEVTISTTVQAQHVNYVWYWMHNWITLTLKIRWRNGFVTSYCSKKFYYRIASYGSYSANHAHWVTWSNRRDEFLQFFSRKFLYPHQDLIGNYGGVLPSLEHQNTFHMIDCIEMKHDYKSGKLQLHVKTQNAETFVTFKLTTKSKKLGDILGLQESDENFETRILPLDGISNFPHLPRMWPDQAFATLICNVTEPAQVGPDKDIKMLKTGLPLAVLREEKDEELEELHSEYKIVYQKYRNLQIQWHRVSDAFIGKIVLNLIPEFRTRTNIKFLPGAAFMSVDLTLRQT